MTGEVRRARSILNRSKGPAGDFTANPYLGCAHACSYCYAEYMGRFQGIEDPWGTFVIPKEWPDVSGRDLRGRSVWIGTACDPYQPMEETEGRTRALLEQLARTGAEVTVCTRSALVRRDLDLLARMGARLVMSVNTHDESVRADLDRGSTLEERCTALFDADTAGIPTVLFCSPFLPGITDLAEVAMMGTASSVDEVWVERLVLNGPYRGRMLYWCRTRHPEAWPLWEAIFQQGDLSLWGYLDDLIEELDATGYYPKLVNQGGHDQ